MAQLQGGAPVSASGTSSNEANPAQAAFEAFQRANSSDDMRQAVAQHPIMTDSHFIAAIEQAIQGQVPSELKPAFQQRLDVLKGIAAALGK